MEEIMFKVIAKMATVPGKSKEFIASVAKMAPQTRAMKGCLAYNLTQSRTDENIFIFVEEWENNEVFKQHFSEEFTKVFESELEGVLASGPEPYECNIVV